MNLVQNSSDIPKPPQNKTLWTIVVQLGKKVEGYDTPDSIQMISEESQTASSDRESAIAIRAEV